MDKVATFLKVSKDQYVNDRTTLAYDIISEDEAAEEYKNIILPSRATTGSAGYDFYLPHNASFGKTPMRIATGIRARIDPGYVLILFPRSGLGFKHGFRLMNTAGVIDSDYFNADNEGHIIVKAMCDESFRIPKGDRFVQGVLLPYGIATNDHILMNQRTGGFGSTGN